ncbi:PQQ-dependent dehydrogenase, methanol/ethanol family [Polymorphobacter fuscus]|uniref:PQQ-dependent dehydrogenase, methanol/ethanol family n=1 Tax=Sandarakinorhabdus fusca TaxID=1439888 RepID=A0A7C9KVU1_9SPHN|nr:PQQ-dependent dehydrogenase, methanol/ethanol family [Polymorphobacter fuscus]KAB7648629.1 PQQ-dependent dehydrogenase, methanol/ethanol family [Polymorphobacter fuscus]MQT16182.1 PQQ-dependent dehydrogenase, methanol/ethanol family [Polymorphobacter fuscus]NJC07535.1 quinohemoprotein ethanol dehydrogenase [Polymorphobacter fuscus]
MKFATGASAAVIASLLWAGAATQGEAASSAPAARVDAARLANAAAEPGNWMTHGGTYAEQRYADLDQINTGNVGQLGLAWSHELDSNRGQEATPLIIDGTMYTTTAWSKVVALDAATGAVKWTYDPQVPKDRGHAACCDVVNRGLAAYDGKLFLGALDGRLIALDAATGKPVWTTQTFDKSQPYTITGAPRVVKGKVIIGNGGAELGVRGYVTAYDAQTGKKAWRFYTIPGNPAKGPDGEASDPVLQAKAGESWFGKYWEAGGGGTVWDAIVYDQELDQLYIGVGNGSPWNHQVRSEGKGDNLFLSSVVALDPNTGRYLWHYQGTPAESWDFTQTQPIMLATLPIDGRPRKVLMQAPKNGFFYVIDRETGKLISAKGFVPQTWTKGVDMATGRPIEVEGQRFPDKATALVAPSALGAHNWHPMAFSPKTGLVYLPAQEVPFAYQTDKDYVHKPGAWNIAVVAALNAPPNSLEATRATRAILKGQLLAWDPVQQKEAWRVQYDGPWNGGALATAGNLVFQGNAKGQFQAFDAASGKPMWAFDAQTGVVAGPVSFKVGDTQYVAVMAGYGGAYPMSTGFPDGPQRVQPNGRVLVFKLGGTAKLPPYEAPALAPANPPSQTFTAAQIARGGTVFEGNCGICHGAGARSSGLVPDLRRSAALTDAESWAAVVHGGILKDQGMVSFAKWFSRDDIESVRAYVGEQAKFLASDDGAKLAAKGSAGQ